MRRPSAVLALLGLLGILGACDAPSAPSRTAPEADVTHADVAGGTVTDSTTVRVSPRPTWSPETTVRSTLSALAATKVEVTADDALRVSTAWVCTDPACGRKRAIATSVDGFRTARYEAWSDRRYDALFGPAPSPPPHLDAEGLLAETVVSLAPGADRQRVAVMGGDGATFLPFDRVARSLDGGATWTTHTVVHGRAMPYSSGSVVLPDGRLLVLLPLWSSDRGGARPGPEHHGLWVSTDPDLTRFVPADAGIDDLDGPKVMLSATAANGGVLWVLDGDGRLWVSRDGKDFRKVRTR